LFISQNEFLLISNAYTFTFLNTRIWWGAYNRAVALRITGPICMLLVVTTTDRMFR